jgi:hypothetical protein
MIIMRGEGEGTDGGMWPKIGGFWLEGIDLKVAILE